MAGSWLNAVPLLLQLPLGEEENFRGVIDLIGMKQITWDDESLGAAYSVEELTEADREMAQPYRDRTIETLAEMDDEVMDLWLSEQPIGTEMVQDAIRRAAIGLKLTPVLCGTALRNKGIQPLLDAIVRYLPSPADVPPITGVHPKTGGIVECPARENAPLAALIFKVAIVEGRKLSYVRIYSGLLREGDDVYNPFRNKKEKISRILRMHANKRDTAAEAPDGNDRNRGCGWCSHGPVHSTVQPDRDREAAGWRTTSGRTGKISW